jgi:hypothetical protein
VRKLPVLRGFFNGKAFDTNPELPAHVGWGVLPMAGNAGALTFRIQKGPNVLYWLANPSDPFVWDTLDKWAAAKTMVLAAEFEDGLVLVHRSFNLLHPVFNAWREAVKDDGHTVSFMSEATRLLASDGLKDTASTDIPAYPQLQHVQGCMVRTEHTGGVTLMLNDEAPGPNGAVADAVAALAKAMLQPDKPRH